MKPEMLRAEGLRAEDFIQATGLTRRRKRASTAHSKMSLEELREAAAAEAINGEIGKMVTAITVAAEVFAGASGRITGNTELTTRGVVRDMTIHTTLKPDQRLQEIPVLLPNGTPQLDTVRQFFPRLVVREPPAVVAPYAETRQIVGGFAKGTVDNQRSQRKRKELNRWLRLHALGESASGFVGFKGTKAEITAGVPGMLPPRHHGQNAGDDELRDVGVHVVQDGMRLPGAEIERQVRAKTGRAPTTLETMRAPGRVLMTDGTGKEIPDVLRYGDPDMQAEYRLPPWGERFTGSRSRPRRDADSGKSSADIFVRQRGTTGRAAHRCDAVAAGSAGRARGDGAALARAFQRRDDEGHARRTVRERQGREQQAGTLDQAVPEARTE